MLLLIWYITVRRLRFHSVWIDMQTILRSLFCDTVDKLRLDSVGLHWMDHVLLLLSKISTSSGIQRLTWIHFTTFSGVILCSGRWILTLVVELAFHRWNNLIGYSGLVTGKLSVWELSWLKGLTGLKLRWLRLAEWSSNKCIIWCVITHVSSKWL